MTMSNIAVATLGEEQLAKTHYKPNTFMLTRGRRSARVVHAAVAGLCCLALQACASVEVGRANLLARSNSKGVAALDAAAGGVVQSVRAQRANQGISDALLDIPASTPPSEYQELISHLESRRRVSDQLSTTYAAFASLADYDAAAEFNASATSLYDSIDAFGAQVSNSVKVERSLITSGGGELLSWGQARRLKAANKALLVSLKSYSRLLDNDSQAYISIGQSAVRAHFAVVRLLWKAGDLDASSLIGQLEPEEGFSLTKQGRSYTQADPTTDRLVRAVLTSRESSALAAVEDADSTRRKIVTQLIQSHEDFAAGRALDLAEMIQLAQHLAFISQTAHDAGKAK